MAASTDLAERVDADAAQRAAELAKALADPVRIQLFDVLRRQGAGVCQCELQPLFGISQSTLSHHLRTLREAGVVGVQRRGLWAYYYVNDEPLEALRTWLS